MDKAQGAMEYLMLGDIRGISTHSPKANASDNHALSFRNRGQGAMEYLMSYSWAILVVIAVGFGVWQMGIFDMGEVATTSSGFQQIKPILQTCQAYYSFNNPAVLCNFLNMGPKKTLKGMTAEVEGTDSCVLTVVDNMDTMPRTLLQSNCNQFGCSSWCIYMNGVDNPSCDESNPSSSAYGRWLPLDHEQQIFLSSILCGNLENDTSTLDFGFVYDIEIGDVTTTKTEYGKVIVPWVGGQ
jgi:hypothetical protein